MSDITFIYYPPCSTCKRAKKWLDTHNIRYKERHIVEENPTAQELAAWHARADIPLRRLFNTSGKLYRENSVKTKLDDGISSEEAYALLAENGMMVKRPIIVGEDFALFGFKEDQWTSKLIDTSR